jgi:hypothetical protein
MKGRGLWTYFTRTVPAESQKVQKRREDGTPTLESFFFSESVIFGAELGG